MTTLIFTVHPDSGSRTHQAARRLHQQLGAEATELAHLAQEGFDPRFTPDDRQLYVGCGVADPAVLA